VLTKPVDGSKSKDGKDKEQAKHFLEKLDL